MTLHNHIQDVDSDKLNGERLRVFYVPVREAIFWDRNPKKHDIGVICESIMKYGFKDPAAYDATLGAFVEGNGRTEALMKMERMQYARPDGVLEHTETGFWYMPVLFGVDAKSTTLAEQYGIDHNNTVLAGEFTLYDMARMWDKEQYQAVLQDLSAEGEMPLTMSADDLMLLLNATDINTTEVPDGATSQSQEDVLDDHEYEILTITINNVNLADDIYEQIKDLLEENPGWDAEIGRHK